MSESLHENQSSSQVTIAVCMTTLCWALAMNCSLYYVFHICEAICSLPFMQENPVQFVGWEDPLKKGQAADSSFLGFSGGSAGKESAYNRETCVKSLGWEDPLKKGTATHSSILAWRIPWTVQFSQFNLVAQ